MNVLRILECLILLLLKLWRLNQYKMVGTFLPFCRTHAIGQVAVLLLIDARGRQILLGCQKIFGLVKLA
jgi:hypothetical protein